MTADEIATILENIGRLLALKGENPFKIRAYQNGARAIEMFTGNLRTAAEKGELNQVEGLGKALSEKISELVLTGKMEFYENLREEFPAGILDLFELPGLGEKKIKLLHAELGVTGIPKLEEACRDGRIAKLAGFGEKTALKLLAAIETRKSTADLFVFGSIASDARAVQQALRDHPAVGQVSPAGSYRRRKEIVHDLDFVASTREPEAVGEYFASLPEVTGIIAQGKTKISVRLRSGVPCDLRLVSDAEFPFALQYFTGSKEHNVALRQRAMNRGWTLNEYRIAPTRDDADPIPPIAEEREVYAALGLELIEPELRENHGELEAAEKRELPELVQLEHLRGTFHNHTTASDGRDSLRAMCEAAQELGLQYLGIADHSKSSVIANGLSEQRLEAQLKEIEQLNAEYRGTFRVFSGTECDIHKDGTLDFDDDLLARLDYVVASVHINFTLSEAEQTARIVRAMENKYVTMLGHVTGRLLLQRAGYQVDIPAVIDAAARTGTIIELNANPRRLDMDWRWWKSARDKGVQCAINPDAHRTEGLQDLWFGIGAARKGWLRREDVINTLSTNEVEKVLKAKRRTKKD